MNRNYCSYLIRIWREKETAPWRASITHVLTGEIHKFADPQMVFDYLQANWLADSHDAQPFNDSVYSGDRHFVLEQIAVGRRI